MAARADIEQVALSLLAEGQAVIYRLHETALALGCRARISPMGKKPDDWKCEYVAGKPPQALRILRVTGQRFSLRAKLLHLAEYAEVLQGCTEHCRASLLSASKDCEKHGGGCAGPISFTLDGRGYSKCRHYFLFAEIAPEDVDGIRQLLQHEAHYTES